MPTSDFRPEEAGVRPHMLIRARLPFFSHAQQPTYQYLHATTEQWGTFENATRFPADIDTTAPLHMAPPHEDATLEWMHDLARDLDGWPYDPNDGTSTWRLTKCCAAAASISDGPYYCKSCYEEQPLDVDHPPRLDGNWKPGDGPITIQLDRPDS